MANSAKILVVDDDVNFTTTTVDLFNEKGFDCIGVHSGYKAIDKVKEVAFDVILLDIKMPVMNGVEAYKEIKKIRPETVVIMATAYRMEELIRDALKEGVYAVLNKPLDVDKVVAMIERSKKGGALIQVVDDDPNIREKLKDSLEKQGFSVTTASDGEEAIRITKERPHDILFVDAKVAPIGGLLVFLEARKFNPDVVAVIMTEQSNKSEDVVEKALKEGAYACLYKPFSVGEVVEVLEAIVSKKKGGE